MKNFQYHNPTRICFGRGQIAAISPEIPSDAHVMVTYGGGSIKRNGTYDQVMSSLKGHYVVEFGGIEPNPSYETLMKAVDLAQREKVDFLLAVGGGSVIDGTKFIAAALLFEGEPWHILSEQAPVCSAVPLGCVLTLPATGSESNADAVITRKATQDKLSFASDMVYPVFAIMDPETTFSLPEKQTANGVVDAFVHVMEQYLTVRDGAEVQDRYAEALLQTLIEFGPKVLQKPDDYDVRATVMWAANQALNGLIGVGVPQDWATHMIGHEITAVYGLDHAQTLAIILPSVMTVMEKDKRKKLLQYARRVWHIADASEDVCIQQAVEQTRRFFEKMGIKTRLSDYGVGQEAVDVLVGQLERHQMVALGENKNISSTIAEKILRHSC
ncbi:Alcohol dehydrogenase YqhD [invertebrate metagenome]|uniref:Alcohol dehydrogenase YqhD n=1 Tax=invertebrate metagenome TaxID=1711999 RepID=A0A2H9T7G0_9ZZZZ